MHDTSEGNQIHLQTMLALGHAVYVYLLLIYSTQVTKQNLSSMFSFTQSNVKMIHGSNITRNVRNKIKEQGQGTVGTDARKEEIASQVHAQKGKAISPCLSAMQVFFLSSAAEARFVGSFSRPEVMTRTVDG